MIKRIISICFCLLFALSDANANHYENCHISGKDINNGYLVKKVWLEHFAIPQVQVSDLKYISGVSLPAKVQTGDPQQFKIMLGMERKRPFALVTIPVYVNGENNGEVKQLSDFAITVTEMEVTSTTLPKTSSVVGSPLAQGTWYKIAITNTGLYKIDFNFIRDSLHIDPSTINTNHIRVFGNGGAMLSEANYDPRPDNLLENAIWVNDGGDGSFNQGDYFVFYAKGSMRWDKDSINQRFSHQINLYEDKSYYFLNFDQSNGLRVDNQNTTLTANVNVTDFNDYAVHELDSVNLGQLNLGAFGKEWWGEMFSASYGLPSTRSFNFNLGTLTDSANFRVYLACNTTGTPNNTFTFSVNGQIRKTYTLGGSIIDEAAPVATTNSPGYDDFKAGGLGTGTTTVKLDFQGGEVWSTGYLNYIEINTRRLLALSDGQLPFRDWRSVGTGNIAQYHIQNANSSLQVWDVSNPQVPVKMNGSLSGSNYTFTQDAQQLHEFVTFDGSQYYTPVTAGLVTNQNIHGSPQVNFIIVTHPDFLEAANKLADYHRNTDGMSVLVATTTQIYNEFSSGSQDISAIRDMVKMFYDRAVDSTQMPKYLLLFGAASYDYKRRATINSNFVPVYEYSESMVKVNSYSGDDFYGFLDNNEYIGNDLLLNALDVGVGRITSRNESDAMAVVDKIIHYKSPATLGPWRLSATFVGDAEDGAGPHMLDAETMSGVVNSSTGNNLYNDTKVFLDALSFVSTPGGERCPAANDVINNQIFRGTFLMNYNGHGNTDVWSHERVLSTDDYTTWKNYDNLPFMVTATCDFGQYDNPVTISSGEKLVLQRGGGAIALLTTTSSTYESDNKHINSQFLNVQFTHKDDGTWYTFGDAIRMGKNITYKVNSTGYVLLNYRKFALLGDPALIPDFPKYLVRTDSIRDAVSGNPVDSVSALGTYKIDGSITDAAHNVLSDFNGSLSVVMYDKPRRVTLTTKFTGAYREYELQDNIIYKGKATITNGHFSFSFVAPKDINYTMGNGKISYYADNGITDAASADTTIAVGGYSNNPVTDNDPPVVRAFMNDSLFKDGGITGSNTVLYAILNDATGINVSGNGVGHDLTAVLDGNVETPYILNDYYEAAPNTYQKGYISFPISGISDGTHTLTVKAWDVNDNSGQGSVHFVVLGGNVVQVNDLVNYPNPFSTLTHFFFEHNHPDEDLRAQINIYNTSGQLVKSIDQNFTPTGSRSNEIIWDGSDDHGTLLPGGLYVYRLLLSTQSGISGSAYQKLVLIR
ncbi:MAG: type IX secretion system sortase PorU [Bacteroidota bacterium]